MKLKLKSLGTKSKQTSMPVTSAPGKVVERFPEITLNTKQVKGLKEYAKNGAKCSLTFEGEVTGFRSADEYQIQGEGLSKTDINVTVKLTKGAIMEKEKPGTIREAGMMAKEHNY